MILQLFGKRVDNMLARKNLFKRFKEQFADSDKVRLYIDGRLNAEVFRDICFLFTNKDTNLIAKYEEKFLFDDSDLPDEPCTAKQTSHVVIMIGATMTQIITFNFVANRATRCHFASVDFLTEYDGSTLRFTTKSINDVY